MKYYKYQDNYGPLGEATTYVEVDSGWTMRQITLSDRERHGSNVKYPHWGLMLADQQADYDSIEEVTPINKDEFNRIWNAHLESREAEWINTKRIFPVGSAVSGYIEVFFPQGVIVDLGSDTLGVADYQACRASTKPEFMYSGQHVTAKVTGFDEENQWVILVSPQVHEERRVR